jgi:DNA-directed RNA polymerase specialized sigma24 family protein
MPSESAKSIESLSRKLDVVIGLLIRLRPRPRSEKDDILALKAAGMNVEEIARALGKSPNSVYLMLSRNRKTT